MSRLDEDLDPYSRPNPYEVLSVPPHASATEVRDRHSELQRELQEKGGNVSDIAKRKQELEAAYNRVRVASGRMRVDFFLLDPKLGLKQCEAMARTLAKPNTDVEGMIKPRRIRVTHAALLNDLNQFMAEPDRVTGFHPEPVEIPEAPLPGPLAIQFDC